MKSNRVPILPESPHRVRCNIGRITLSTSGLSESLHRVGRGVVSSIYGRGGAASTARGNDWRRMPSCWRVSSIVFDSTLKITGTDTQETIIGVCNVLRSPQCLCNLSSCISIQSVDSTATRTTSPLYRSRLVPVIVELRHRSAVACVAKVNIVLRHRLVCCNGLSDSIIACPSHQYRRNLAMVASLSEAGRKERLPRRRRQVDRYLPLQVWCICLQAPSDLSSKVFCGQYLNVSSNRKPSYGGFLSPPQNLGPRRGRMKENWKS